MPFLAARLQEGRPVGVTLLPSSSLFAQRRLAHPQNSRNSHEWQLDLDADKRSCFCCRNGGVQHRRVAVQEQGPAERNGGESAVRVQGETRRDVLPSTGRLESGSGPEGFLGGGGGAKSEVQPCNVEFLRAQVASQ